MLVEFSDKVVFFFRRLFFFVVFVLVKLVRLGRGRGTVIGALGLNAVVEQDVTIPMRWQFTGLHEGNGTFHGIPQGGVLSLLDWRFRDFELSGVLLGDCVVAAVLEGANEKLLFGPDLGIVRGRGGHYQGEKPRVASFGLLVRVLGPDNPTNVAIVRVVDKIIVCVFVAG